MLRKQNAPAEWSRRTTRYDPPTLEEAITAAQCLTDQIESQIEIAAQLMGLPEDEVRVQVLTATQTARAQNSHKPAIHIQDRQAKVVVVERRGPRALRRRASS